MRVLVRFSKVWKTLTQYHVGEKLLGTYKTVRPDREFVGGVVYVRRREILLIVDGKFCQRIDKGEL